MTITHCTVKIMGMLKKAASGVLALAGRTFLIIPISY
jgi:hypothetical protein